MTAWGVCATVRATGNQLLAFAGHHLSIGAAHVWLHFDDPDDPALPVLSSLPRVSAIRCDAVWWQADGRQRPEAHQNRQARNIQRLCAEAPLPWIVHLDVDEFLLPDRPVSEILAELLPDNLMLRVAPWEALHDPALQNDIFTARHFRAALRGPDMAGLRAEVFGRHADLLPDGMLSHAAGKCFFRTGIRRLEPRIHGAFYAKARLAGGAFHPDLSLLHFHAQDPADWIDRLPFRLTRGAYQYNPALQSHLVKADAAEIAAFYAAVQCPAPNIRDLLRRSGLLREASLHLRQRVEDLRMAT